MIEKSTTQRVLEEFFENPAREFHLRELARLMKLSMPTIISSTDKLAKIKLITKTKGPVLTKVAANRESTAFIRHKRVHNLEKIYTSGLVGHLSSSYNNPKAIILFGSFSRGDDTEKSDIDVAVITKKKLDLDNARYENALKKAISVHEIDLKKISDEFKANLLNGIILEGSW
ncbi:nucleotidyltransferase domain-containing protein [Candidatus Woesearchaeota archaeon]|nr:nucleotidyltransferase domain-containing protein [Candidatus Woesearchaeota archaeon]MBI2130213.1 nucleotidyltransferase domain-containing protein [Candidatus Woesearchaeota archaeon]